MIKVLLQKAIEQKNEFMTPEMIQLQIEFFRTAGKITAADRDELLGMINPQNEVVENELEQPDI